MRVTLFWYMRVSPFLEFARCCSGHTGRSLASGPGSQVPKVCFLGGARKKFERRTLPWFSDLFWEEPRPRRGAQCEAEDQVPTAPERPRSCDRAKDGIHNGRHAPEQSFRLHTGCGSSPQLQSDWSWHVYRKKGAIRQRSCPSKGSCSPTPPDTRTDGKSQPD